MTAVQKTTAIFLKPFELASFAETLPAGEYEIEAAAQGPLDGIDPTGCTSRVRVHLHARPSYPGLARTLTVELAELDLAAAKDKLTGKALSDFFLEDKLSDPMIRLFMRADAVSEAEVRGAYAGTGGEDQKGSAGPVSVRVNHDAMSPRWGSARPGIGE